MKFIKRYESYQGTFVMNIDGEPLKSIVEHLKKGAGFSIITKDPKEIERLMIKRISKDLNTSSIPELEGINLGISYVEGTYMVTVL